MSADDLPSPRIEIRREGAFYRMAVEPRDALPRDSFSRPSTYSAHSLAATGAKLLGDATGWPVVDMTKSGA